MEAAARMLGLVDVASAFRGLMTCEDEWLKVARDKAAARPD